MIQLHHKLLCCIILLLVGACSLVAQESTGSNNIQIIKSINGKPDPEKEEKKEDKEKLPSSFVPITFGAFGNTQDLLIGIETGYGSYSTVDIVPGFYFYGRPYEKTRFVEKTTNHYYQFREYLIIYGFSLDIYYWFSKSIALWGGTAIGPYYRGFFGSDQEESGFNYRFSTGIAFGNKYGLVLKCGYTYMNLPDVPDNFLNVSLQYRF